MATTPSVLSVPSLTSAGWIRSIPEAVDAIMAYYFESDYNQSTVYAGTISSVQYDIEQTSHDISATVARLRRSLEQLFSRYFPEGANATVTANDTPDNQTGAINITLDVIVTQDGKNYAVSAALAVNGTKFTRFNNLNRQAQLTAIGT